jgi:hypothetical protein
LKNYKSPGSDEIPAESIQAEGEALVFVIQKRINFILTNEELSDQWNEPIIVHIHKKGD